MTLGNGGSGGGASARLQRALEMRLPEVAELPDKPTPAQVIRAFGDMARAYMTLAAAYHEAMPEIRDHMAEVDRKFIVMSSSVNDLKSMTTHLREEVARLGKQLEKDEEKFRSEFDSVPDLIDDHVVRTGRQSVEEIRKEIALQEVKRVERELADAKIEALRAEEKRDRELADARSAALRAEERREGQGIRIVDRGWALWLAVLGAIAVLVGAYLSAHVH